MRIRCASISHIGFAGSVSVLYNLCMNEITPNIEDNERRLLSVLVCFLPPFTCMRKESQSNDASRKGTTYHSQTKSNPCAACLTLSIAFQGSVKDLPAVLNPTPPPVDLPTWRPRLRRMIKRTGSTNAKYLGLAIGDRAELRSRVFHFPRVLIFMAVWNDE